MQKKHDNLIGEPGVGDLLGACFWHGRFVCQEFTQPRIQRRGILGFPFVRGNCSPQKQESARSNPRIYRSFLCEFGVNPLPLPSEPPRASSPKCHRIGPEESSGSSDDGDMKKKKGNRAMGKKKYPKAVKWYTKAIKIDPENPTYFLNRAIANSALELWKAAEEDAASAVELGDPPSAKSHYQLARARLRRERYGEARSALQAGLSANPSEAALLQLSKELEAACRISEDKSQKAEEAKSAPSQGPSGARALLEQARSAYSAGMVEQAVSLLQSARAPLPAEATKDRGPRPGLFRKAWFDDDMMLLCCSTVFVKLPSQPC